MAKANQKFYNSALWKRLRLQKLGENPVCEICKRRPASDVDHVKAMTLNGDPFDWENLRSLCHECHSRKTLYLEKLGRNRVPIKGCTASGQPLDPTHWWNN